MNCPGCTEKNKQIDGLKGRLDEIRRAQKLWEGRIPHVTMAPDFTRPTRDVVESILRENLTEESKKNDQLRVRVAELDNELRQRTDERDRAQKIADMAQNDRSRVVAKNCDLIKSLNAQREEIDRLKVENVRLKTQGVQYYVTPEAMRVENELVSAKTDLRFCRDEKHKLEEELTRTQVSLERSEENLEISRQDRKALEARVESLEEGLRATWKAPKAGARPWMVLKGLDPRMGGADYDLTVDPASVAAVERRPGGKQAWIHLRNGEKPIGVADAPLECDKIDELLERAGCNHGG
jgi:chromosome segregation ATPase